MITIKPNFLIRTIAGENILIGAGEQIDFSQMLLLNETAVFLIQQLQQRPHSLEELAQQMTNHYDVSYSEALIDTRELIRQLESLGIAICSEPL